MLDLTNKKISDICNQNDITYLGLFGSYSRGEEKPASDVDLLADFSETKSLFELVDIQDLFSEFFNRPVDLVLKKNLKPRIQPYVFADLKTIYEKR